MKAIYQKPFFILLAVFIFLTTLVFYIWLPNLSFISQIASLTDEDGNSDTSSTWEGSPPGGHHREGKLSFTNNLTETKSATLILPNIAGITKREFTWQL